MGEVRTGRRWSRQVGLENGEWIAVPGPNECVYCGRGSGRWAIMCRLLLRPDTSGFRMVGCIRLARSATRACPLLRPGRVLLGPESRKP